MAVLFVLLTVVVVVVIGLVSIGGVTAKLAAQPPRPLFDVDEAVDYVAERLPDDVTAQLSYEDVQHLVEWHLEYLEAKGAARMIEEHRVRGRADADLETDRETGEELQAEDVVVERPPEHSSDPSAEDRVLEELAVGADLPVVAEDDEGVAFVLGRAGAAGLEVEDVQVVQVLEVVMTYLDAIGALGEAVDPPA